VFLDVDVWDRLAETCQQYLSKGSPVFIEGRLQMDSWDDKETGQKRTRLKVRAERVQFSAAPRRDGAVRDTAAARPGAGLRRAAGQTRGGRRHSLLNTERKRHEEEESRNGPGATRSRTRRGSARAC
jgi:single-strand DNA-binding protein